MRPKVTRNLQRPRLRIPREREVPPRRPKRLPIVQQARPLLQHCFRLPRTWTRRRARRRRERELPRQRPRTMTVLPRATIPETPTPVSYTHLRAHETVLDLVCRLLLEKKK